MAQAGAQRRAGRDDLGSDFRVSIRRQIGKTDALEIAAAPALLMGQEIPLAGQGADRTRRRFRSAKRQIVGEVEEMTGLVVARRQMPLQPKQFWDFHFRRDRAADIAQHVVLCVVDFAGFGNRAVVHPDDDIAPVVAGATDRQRIGVRVEHHQRACRIEPEALDGGRRNRRLRHRGADGSRACGPDFGRRLFDHAAGLMPDRDRMPGGCQQTALLVKYSGARTRCSDVDADEGLPHCNPVQDQRKLTSTYNRRRRARRSRSSGLRRPTPGTGQRRQFRRPPPSGPLACRQSRHRTSADCF